MKISAKYSLLSLALLAFLTTSVEANTFTINQAGTSFSPDDLTIEVGDTVIWQWSGGNHTVTEGTDGTIDGDEAFHSPLNSTVTSYTVTFDAAFLAANPRINGRYDYFCSPHFSFGMTGVVTVNLGPGTGYCFGDPGMGTPCPCSNDNDGSVPGSGCDNGAFASGAQLTGSGVASVSGDTLVLKTTGLEPSNTGLYFQGNNATNGGAGNPFGDGLRCAGGGLVRLQIRTASAGGTSQTSVAIAAKGGVIAGDTRRYQCWYRTTQNPPCGLGVNDFNLSNGYEITWTP